MPNLPIPNPWQIFCSVAGVGIIVVILAGGGVAYAYLRGITKIISGA